MNNKNSSQLSELISNIKNFTIPGNGDVHYMDELMALNITPTNVEFKYTDSDYPNKPVDYTMPTGDFVQILELWWNFLTEK